MNSDLIRRYVTYNPETGLFVWKERSVAEFTLCQSTSASRICSAWNARHAGNRAFCTVNSAGYFYGRIHRVSFAAHRVAYALHHGYSPHGHIDHINGDRADNRIINLRDVDPWMNSKNCKRRSDNTSGATGIRHVNGRYSAEICVDGHRRSLGVFDALGDAVQARKEAERKGGFHANHGRSALVQP
jgi:hypothetical protein